MRCLTVRPGSRYKMNSKLYLNMYADEISIIKCLERLDYLVYEWNIHIYIHKYTYFVFMRPWGVFPRKRITCLAKRKTKSNYQPYRMPTRVWQQHETKIQLMILKKWNSCHFVTLFIFYFILFFLNE